MTSEHINRSGNDDKSDDVAEMLKDRIDTFANPAVAYDAAAAEYLINHGYEAGEAYSNLRERDRAAGIDVSKIPGCTIYISIAINESEDNIRKVLELIKNEGLEDPEIILYGNYTEDATGEEQLELTARLDRIIADNKDTPEFSALRSTVTPTRPYHDFSMVQLRKECVDMIALDGFERGDFAFNHPVLSLDADVLRTTKGTLRALIDPIMHEGVTLTYGNTNFGYTDLPDDDASRLAVTAEISRRMEMRDGSDFDPYPEESCTAFSLGAYFLANGYPSLIRNTYNKSNLSGETPKLIRRMNSMLNQTIYGNIVNHALGIHGDAYAPRHITEATITLNGHRMLKYFKGLIAEANSSPDRFHERYAPLERMSIPPTLDRHIGTGGAYNDSFKSNETLRADNALSSTEERMSDRARRLILRSYFGLPRLQHPDTNKFDPDAQTKSARRLRIQRMLIHRYLRKD